MATGHLPSGFSTSDALETLSQKWTADLRGYSPQWLKIAEIITKETVDAGQVRLVYANAPGQFGEFDSDTALTAGTIAYGAGPVVTLTTRGRGQQYTVSPRDWKRDFSVVDRMAQKLVDAAKNDMDKVVFGAINTSITDTYNDGTGTPAFVSGTHTLLDGVTTQSTDINASLSETALNSALANLAKRKNYTDGAPLNLGKGPKALVVPEDLASTAFKLVKSRMLPHQDGSNVGDVDNYHASLPWEVVSSAHLSSATNWFVMDLNIRPLKVWMTPSMTPSIHITQDPDSLVIKVNCIYEIAAGFQGPPDGLVGSTP